MLAFGIKRIALDVSEFYKDPENRKACDKWKEEVRQKDIFYALDNDEADHDGMEVVTIAVTGDDDEE